MASMTKSFDKLWLLAVPNQLVSYALRSNFCASDFSLQRLYVYFRYLLRQFTKLMLTSQKNSSCFNFIHIPHQQPLLHHILSHLPIQTIPLFTRGFSSQYNHLNIFLKIFVLFWNGKKSISTNSNIQRHAVLTTSFWTVNLQASDSFDLVDFSFNRNLFTI